MREKLDTGVPLTDEHRLIDRCLRGDERAWDELVERYGRLVYSVPRRLGFSAEDADDVFQVVFGIVLRRLETLRQQDRFSAWLLRTTYREAWRLAKRRREHGRLDQDIPDSDEPTDAEVLRQERQQAVRTAVATLDKRCRKLLEASFFAVEPPSYEEIAESLGMKVGSIGPTRARCLGKLGDLLGDFAT